MSPARNKPRRTLMRCATAVALLVLAVSISLKLQFAGEETREVDPNRVVPTEHRARAFGGSSQEEVGDGPSYAAAAAKRASTRDDDENDDDARRYIVTDADGAAWTESHVPRDVNRTIGRDVRISFRLHDPAVVPRPSKFLSVSGYTCHGGEGLPLSLSGRTLLDFTTTVSTDLNILFVGDSIVQQFAQGFYASVLGEDNEGSHVVVRSFINAKHFGKYNNYFGLHVCSSLVAPSRGGGTSAYWRVLGLMSNRTEEMYYVNCKNQMGWVAQEGKKLARHAYSYPPRVGRNELFSVNTTKNNGATTWYRSRVVRDDDDTDVDNAASPPPHRVGGFDACVLRPPHGWMQMSEITRDRIVEEIELCHAVVGARTVVVTTLPLNNNVITPEDWEGIIGINAVIRDIAHGWKWMEDGVRWVLVQEFGNFTNQILWRNAEHIGYNITVPDFTRGDGWEQRGSEFLLHRYRGIKKNGRPPSIPMVCAHHIEQPFSTENATARQCFFNRISPDGMHWCVETLGPRYSAGVACLLGCVHNGGDEGEKVASEVRRCERECNDRFLSLVPVDEGWIGTNATIYSKS